jgi:hypothetical protein
MRRRARLLASVALAALPASAQLPDDLEVGAYVEVKGSLHAGGVAADEVEVQAVAHALDRLRGIVDSVAPAERTLVVAGVILRLAADARLTDAAGRPLEISALQPGAGVDARGRYAGGELLTHSLALAGGAPENGQVRLEGVIDAVDAEADAFRLLGLGVRVTPRTSVELD